MSNHTRTHCWLLVLTSVLVSPAIGRAAAPQTDVAMKIQEMQRAIRREVDVRNIPAFSLALVDGNTILWQGGFGHRDAQKQQPATANTVYRVGSVSKLFTDIAVMQLVERGELDLDEPVRTYLPSFHPKNPFDVPITLRHLMSHQSGLVREPPVGHYFDPTEPTMAETIASLNSTTLVYRPGSRVKYSNAGVTVVGAVLAAKTGRSFTESVTQSVFEPLHLENSSFALTDAVRDNFATGWMWTYDDRRFEAPAFELGTTPAGSLYSSVNDLSRLLLAMLADGKGSHGRLLRADTLAEMLTPQKDANNNPLRFGLGFHISSLDGHRKVGHGGAIYGFSTQLTALPEKKMGVVAISSLDGSNGFVSRIADYALRVMLACRNGQPVPGLTTTGPIPPARARTLVGDYESTDGPASINELNGRVFLSAGTFRNELRSTSDGGVVVDDVIRHGTTVSLGDDDRLRVGDRTYNRVADEVPADAPQAWHGLIGEYGWDHNTLYILEDRGRLVALIEWFYAYPLKQLSRDEFAFPDYGLYHGEKLKFTRDEHGRATRVVAAEVLFKRREVGTKDGETFRIIPVRPIAELRAEALAAKPPTENGRFRDANLVDVAGMDRNIRLDIRYASTNNFTGSVFYRQPRAFMQQPAAEALVRANSRLSRRGLGLLIHDAYRPWHVTRMFWDATPESMKDFVADPARGSRHNRGCAVDITLYDRDTGEPIQMVAGYDEFSARSFPMYPGGTSRKRWYRDLLRRTMEAEQFTVYEFEWWHFDFADWKKYRIGNATFEEIDSSKRAR